MIYEIYGSEKVLDETPAIADRQGCCVALHGCFLTNRKLGILSQLI
jgi:hypothetical protein